MWKPSRLARNGFCWRECTVILLIVLGFCYVYWDPDPSRTPPLKGDDTVINGPIPNYAFTLSVIPRRVKYLCLVLDSLWQQTIPPRDVFIFHGPEVTDLPDCGAHNPYSSFMVPDTGPGIKLRHFLRAQNGTGPSLGPTLPVDWDVIVVDDDSIMHPELAQTLLLAKRRYPGSVIVNDAYEVYEFYRVTVWGTKGYLVPGEVLRRVEWRDNPKCFYDDDVWLGHLMRYHRVLIVSTPGVVHQDIFLCQLEKKLFGAALSRSVNKGGVYRTLCTRSLLTTLPLLP